MSGRSRRRRWIEAVAASVLLAAAVLLVRPDAATRAGLDQAGRPILVLVSFDGYRWDYFERFDTPALHGLAARGVRSEGLVPPFPSKTYPSHYTIVTGLLPAHHGIVSNNMVDPALPGRFTLPNREVQADPRWWGGEPIWITAQRQGLKTGTMFWPGSDMEIAGARPTHWRAFDDRVPNRARTEQVLEWLRLPEPDRPSFLTSYYSAVDTAGHQHGPESPQVVAAAERLDTELAHLLEGIRAAGLAAQTHVLVVSDHGMAGRGPDRMIYLDDYVDMTEVDVIDWTPVLGVAPKDATRVDALYRALRGRHPSLEVFRSAELPERFGLAGHPRLAPVVGLAAEGWTITTRAAVRSGFAPPKGLHGYDSRLRSMHGLLVGAGPRLREGAVVPPLEAIHLYELMCELLGIEPAPNDGDPAATRALLR